MEFFFFCDDDDDLIVDLLFDPILVPMKMVRMVLGVFYYNREFYIKIW